jgi:hypothetical protein
VRNLTGQPVFYQVNPTDTILTLKRRVREKEGIPVLKMIFMRGKILDNDKTLSDYQIDEKSTIYMQYRMGGGFYCAGCILPALVYLSANVSLQCGENLSFDDVQLLHSIKTKLTSLNNGITEAIINCIETCGSKWSDIEDDDANYFQDHAERRRSQAVDRFIDAICNMINPYIKEYRTSKMIEKMPYAVDYKNLYGNNCKNDSESTLTKPIDVDWVTFLHETRCPICFYRFSNVQHETNTPNRY